MRSVKLKVQGMHCDGCAATLETLLGTEPGVNGVSVSHELGEARVLFNPELTSVGQLIEIAKRPGFDVQEEPDA